MEKKSARTKKKFASKLIHGAFENNWEQHDIANLLQLILQQLDLSEEDAFTFLEICDICDPLILVHVADDLSCDHIIHLMMSQGINQFLKHLDDAFEQGLFTLQDDETREALLSLADTWDDENRLEYAIKLCEQADTKKTCALLLNSFTQHMSSSSSSSPTEAVVFIQEILSYDYFQDLTGTLEHDFLPQFPEDVREHLVKLLEGQNRRRGRSGELVDSDEDEDGNLRGFIVDEEDDDDDDDDVIDLDSSDDEDDGSSDKKHRLMRQTKDSKNKRKTKQRHSKERTSKSNKASSDSDSDSSSDSDSISEIHSTDSDGSEDDDDDTEEDNDNKVNNKSITGKQQQQDRCFSENCRNSYAKDCPFNMCKVCCLSLQQQFGDGDSSCSINSSSYIKCTRHVLDISSPTMKKKKEDEEVLVDSIESTSNGSSSNHNSNSNTPIKLLSLRKEENINKKSSSKQQQKITHTNNISSTSSSHSDSMAISSSSSVNNNNSNGNNNDANSDDDNKNSNTGVIVKRGNKRRKLSNILESDDDED